MSRKEKDAVIEDIPKADSSHEVQVLQEKMHYLEKQLRRLHGTEVYSTRFSDLCPFPYVRLPDKFKIPEFEKYNGRGNPIAHLKSYCSDLRPLGADEKLLMQQFKRSLTGIALDWYVSLDLPSIKSWDQLCQMFIDQYAFNLDMAPKKEDLEKLSQKEGESFSAYVGRWRTLASQVKNKPTEEVL